MESNSKSESVKVFEVLEPLRRVLPEIPGEPEIEEDGEKWYRGFNGNISQSPLYVTDGHILLLASAIAPALEIPQHDEAYARKYATEEKISAVWTPAREREDTAADFIGACNRGSNVEFALLRDGQGRVIVVNAHLLAFGLKAVRPDLLTVDAAPIEATCLAPGQVPWFNTPLALRKAGALVGLLMPMRMGADEFAQYNLEAEPIELDEAVRG